MTTLPMSQNLKQAKKWSFVGTDGQDVLPDAAVFDIRVTSGGKVVSEPVEKGSFFSYNKVNSPLEITSELSFSGTDAYLQSVISLIETLKTATKYFSIVTPVYEYERMTLQNYDYNLNATDGLGVLRISAQFVEIREVDVAYSSANVPLGGGTDGGTISADDAKNKSDAGQVDTGTTTPTEPTEGQKKQGETALHKAIGKIGLPVFQKNDEID